MKLRMFLLSLIFIIFNISDCISNDNIGPDCKEIDDYINSLDYDCNNLLNYTGEPVKKFKKYEGRIIGRGNFFLITRDIKHARSYEDKIAVLESTMQNTFPGVFVLGNHNLPKNRPEQIIIGRSQLDYTVNFPRSMLNNTFKIIPKFSDYQSNLKNLINSWFERYPRVSVNAPYQSAYSMAYSKDLLRVKFGMDFSFSDVEQTIDFEAVENCEKLIMVYKIRVNFFSVDVDNSKRPCEFFGSLVTLDEIRPKMNATNPPVLIYRVHYGKVFYVKIETTSADGPIKDFFLKELNNILDVSPEVEKKLQELDDLKIYLFIMSGDKKKTGLIPLKNTRQIKENLELFSVFDKDNIIHPIFYESDFFKSRRCHAFVTGNCDYIDSSRTFDKGMGFIEFDLKGNLSVIFACYWPYIRLDDKGKKYSSDLHGWANNDEVKKSPYNFRYEFPGNIYKINVRVKNVFEGDKTEILFDFEFDNIDYRKVSVWGTTSDPKYKIMPPYVFNPEKN